VRGWSIPEADAVEEAEELKGGCDATNGDREVALQWCGGLSEQGGDASEGVENAVHTAVGVVRMSRVELRMVGVGMVGGALSA